MVFNLNLLLASPSLVVFSACKTKAWRVGLLSRVNSGEMLGVSFTPPVLLVWYAALSSQFCEYLWLSSPKESQKRSWSSQVFGDSQCTVLDSHQLGYATKPRCSLILQFRYSFHFNSYFM